MAVARTPGVALLALKNTVEKEKASCRRAEEALQARREEILDAATELFAEHGYSDAVTQALAERLQVGKGTLYRHFRSKRDLFLAAADRVMRRMRERIDACVAGIEDPLERTTQAIHAFLAFFAEHPEFVELLIQERAFFKDRKQPTYVQHRDRNVTRWREHYRDLIADGRVRDIPVERITDVISDLLYGTIFTNYFSGRRKSPEAQAQDILDIMFGGILSEAERRRRFPVAGSPDPIGARP
jgi:AcrR family transcriptional regulator